MTSSGAPSDVPVSSAEAAPRRSFLKEAAAVLLGGLVGLVPAAVGLATFLNPLRKSVKDKLRPSGSDNGFYKVAALDALPEGTPERFHIIADRYDAWNVYPKQPIGAVFVCKQSPEKLQVFNVTCPHAGCAVDYRAAPDKHYFCPCHNSSFALDGARSPDSPSPRNLDSLDYEIRDNGEVWVRYEDFKTGDLNKVPKT